MTEGLDWNRKACKAGSSQQQRRRPNGPAHKGDNDDLQTNGFDGAS